MLNIGVRVAILAPTVLFLLMVLWSNLFRVHLIDELRDLVSGKVIHQLTRPIRSHYFQVHFADSAVLFIANGLILILELSRWIDGVILLLAGLTLSLTGLISSFVTRRKAAVFLSLILYVVTLSTVVGEFWFLVVVDAEMDLGTWILNVLFLNPWSIFAISSSLFFALFFLLFPSGKRTPRNAQFS